MGRKKTPPPGNRRASGGYGFDFEDQVSAYFILKILLGQPLPRITGIGQRIQNQTSLLNWHLDDLLITTIDEGQFEHIAISCKSNKQVSANGFPKDFIHSVWKQWFNENGPFSREYDSLMLATRVPVPAFITLWSDIKNWANGTDTYFALQQILATKERQKIFASIKNPAKSIGYEVTDKDVLDLIKAIEIKTFDFDMAGSTDTSSAIGESRGLLNNNTIAEGGKLWTSLIEIAKSTRLGTGTIDFTDIWKVLRKKFSLKDHPDYESSWRVLRKITIDSKNEIETTLLNDFTLDRRVNIEYLVASLKSNSIGLISGESGSGKSSIVKTLLDQEYCSYEHVWLKPEQIDLLLNEIRRDEIGVKNSLLSIFHASSSVQNILVIDAAERVPNQNIPKLSKFITELISKNELENRYWSVLIVGQNLANEFAPLNQLINNNKHFRLEIKPLSIVDVRLILNSIPSLKWLANEKNSLNALTNLKTLAWIAQVSDQFHSTKTASISLITIINMIWEYWTGGSVSKQRLLMRFGEDDANFKHKFAICDLDSSEAVTIEKLEDIRPLVLNSSDKCYYFEHDLAADWARFQRLKSIAKDVKAWGVYTGNPRWTRSLQLLGQYLLHEENGLHTSWDVVLEMAEVHFEEFPLAVDILLDALYLDSSATNFLSERSDILFANNGSRLLRLLKRFEHEGSVSDVPKELLSIAGDMGIYLEAKSRSPDITRFIKIGQFLYNHIEKVAELRSPVIAIICERWLQKIPFKMPSGDDVVLRKEFADIALAMARLLQKDQALNVMTIGNSDKVIYRAALCAINDLPDEVTIWALQMAKRKPLDSKILQEVTNHRNIKQEEHRNRLKADEDYRQRHERLSSHTDLSSDTPLPPWSLGPKGRVDNEFRKVVLEGMSFAGFMQVRPLEAGEIILAMLVEDSPKESYDSHSQDQTLGLNYDNDAYPTAYWKSPFYLFLQINPEIALKNLIQLVDFCTSRWESDLSRKGHIVPTTHLVIEKNTHEYRGDGWIFNWSQESSHHTGPLHSTLSALEKWLVELVEKEIDVTIFIELMLKESKSTALLGVLVNLGKYQPTLFLSSLKCLVGVHQLYIWDQYRARDINESFDAFTWSRYGENTFNRAKEWNVAKFRLTSLVLVIKDLLLKDVELSEFLIQETCKWEIPNANKLALESRLLIAQLNYKNYGSVHNDTTGQLETSFICPSELYEDIKIFQKDKSAPLQLLSLPTRAQSFLEGSLNLEELEVNNLYSLMQMASSENLVDLEKDFLRNARLSASVTLLLRGHEWFSSDSPRYVEAQKILDYEFSTLEESSDCKYKSTQGSHTVFLAYYSFEKWLQNSSAENDERLLKIFISHNNLALSKISSLAYQHKKDLGDRYWRLMYLGLLWSGLSMLEPHHSDDNNSSLLRWKKWHKWLMVRSLSAGGGWIEKLDPINVASRIGRLESIKWNRENGTSQKKNRLYQTTKISHGLNTDILSKIFAWIFLQSTSQDSLHEESFRVEMLKKFWSHEVHRLSLRMNKERDEFPVMSHFAYELINELAKLSMSLPVDQSNTLWLPILNLGPRGHYAIRNFFQHWFSLITSSTDSESFRKRWESLVKHICLDSNWASNGPWYRAQEIERLVLGLNSSIYLERLPDALKIVQAMSPYYKQWAELRLHSDEDNLASLCIFLTSKAGAKLRIQGIEWIATSISTHTNLWYRATTTEAFVDLLAKTTAENTSEILPNKTFRDALIFLITLTVSKQLPNAFMLQDRIRQFQ